MGVWGDKTGVLHQQWQDSWAGPQVGAGSIDGDCCNVPQDGNQNQPQED